MSEEEKQAIETMHTIVEFGGDNLLCREHRERLQTVLNLIEKQNKEMEELKQDYQILKDDMEGHRVAYIDTPEFEEKFISKDKIREDIKKFEKLQEQTESVLQDIRYTRADLIKYLKELIGEE